jgi:hypothetical protein
LVPPTQPLTDTVAIPSTADTEPPTPLSDAGVDPSSPHDPLHPDAFTAEEKLARTKALMTQCRPYWRTGTYDDLDSPLCTCGDPILGGCETFSLSCTHFFHSRCLMKAWARTNSDPFANTFQCPSCNEVCRELDHGTSA